MGSTAGSNTARASNTARGSRTARWLTGAVLMFVPMIVVVAGPWSANAFLVYVGLLPALVALREGRRVALVTAVLTPVVMVIGLLVAGSPWLGAAYMVLVAAGVAWSHHLGYPGAGTYIATQAALTVATTPYATGIGPQLEPGSNPVGAGLAMVGFVLVGGLWVVAVARLLLDDLPTSHPPVPDPATLRRFGITLAVLLGIETFVVLSWVEVDHAWWVLLSVLVIVQPDEQATRTRMRQRVLGTVIGGLVAAVISLLAGPSPVITGLGILAGVGSAVACLKAPYWVFTTLLTAALVFLTFSAETAVRGGAERIGFTVVAALAVAATGPVSRVVIGARSRLAARQSTR